MGLGKTIQAIAVLLSERGEEPCGGSEPSIVVAPTSVIYNWEQEIKKFAPQLRSVIINGLPARRRELLDTPGVDVFITTYDILKRDIDNYEHMKFKYIIADEAQNIKNPQTQNAISIKTLNGRTRFALTGTPMENSMTELWSIFDFVMPGYLYTASKFAKFYEVPVVKNDDTQRADLLRRQIAPFILRRLKNDVLNELPEKTETTLYAQMSDEQLKLYAANLLKARGELEEFENEGLNRNRIRILAALTRLRQICCHPSLFMEDYGGGSGKLDLAMETILTAIESGHRILLFSQFTSMLAILRAALEKAGIAYFYLDGRTPAQERVDMVNNFNRGVNKIFLVSLKAGGTGLNLTGADVVIHYDPWWNPAVMEQASDRAHRYGQQKAVQIYNIVAKDSIEERIMELQEKKKDLIDSVITQGASFITKMSEDELRELFA
jgi:SNF2 family DNA or RNA helicase